MEDISSNDYIFKKMSMIEKLLLNTIQSQIHIDETLKHINNEISTMKSQQILIQQSISNIERNENAITNNVVNVVENCNKMGKHIDFIENVYTTVKSPLHYLTKKINYMIGSDTPKELPDIEHDQPTITTKYNAIISKNDTSYIKIYPDISLNLTNPLNPTNSLKEYHFKSPYQIDPPSNSPKSPKSPETHESLESLESPFINMSKYTN
jgi:hypothetical protein